MLSIKIYDHQYLGKIHILIMNMNVNIHIYIYGLIDN